MTSIPAELKYTLTDEWVRVEGNIATLGVTDYAQDSLSDVVFFETVISVGDQVSAKNQIATLESVKAAADVSTPLTGKVIEVNDSLGSTPEMVNSDPYGKAWMVKIELGNPSEMNALLDAAGYEKYLAERSH